jgi:hypothetical protein
MQRNGGGVLARGLDQLAAAQFFQRGLHSAFRKAGRFGEHAQTRGDRFPFLASGLPVEMKKNQIRSGLAIVADDIAHQDIEHVIVDWNGFTKSRHGGKLESRKRFNCYTDKRTRLFALKRRAALDVRADGD